MWPWMLEQRMTNCTPQGTRLWGRRRVAGWWVGATTVAVVALLFVAREAAWAEQTEASTDAESFTSPGSGPLKLSLADCARLAMTYNPDVRDAALTVRAKKLEIGAARGRFAPTLTVDATVRRDVVGETLIINDPRGRYTTTKPVFDLLLSGPIPYGATYGLRATTEIAWSTRFADVISPTYRNTLALELTQPLLRERGSASPGGAMADAKLFVRQAEAQLDAKGNDVLLDVAKAYWELYAHLEDLYTMQGGVKWFEGLIARLRGSRAQDPGVARRLWEEQMADIEAALDRKMDDVLQAERKLLELIYLTDGGEHVSIMIDRHLAVTDRPAVVEENRTLKELTDLAFKNRPEIQDQKEQLSLAQDEVTVQGRKARPKLDLVLNAGLSSFTGEPTVGRAGYQQPKQGEDPSSRNPHPQIVGGMGDAWRQVFNGSMPFIEAGLKFELPFHGRSRRLETNKAEVELQRQKAKLWAIQSKIALEVRDAWMKVRSHARWFNTARESFETTGQRQSEALKDYFAGKMSAGDVSWAGEFVGRTIGGPVWSGRAYMVARAELARAIGEIKDYMGVK